MSIGKRDPKEVQEKAEDHRAAPRHRQYKAAKLVFNDDQSVIDCVLRDISATGARVKVGAGMVFPDQIILKLSDGVTYSADLKWHRNDELGLHFHGEAKMEMTGKVSAVRSALDMVKAMPMDRLLHTFENYHDFSDDGVKYAVQEYGSAHEILIETLRTVLHEEEKKVHEEEKKVQEEK